MGLTAITHSFEEVREQCLAELPFEIPQLSDEELDRLRQSRLRTFERYVGRLKQTPSGEVDTAARNWPA